jgi:hypothetical protein
MSLHDRITGALFPARLDNGSDVTLATGFRTKESGTRKNWAISPYGSWGQGSPHDLAAYFEDVETWNDLLSGSKANMAILRIVCLANSRTTFANLQAEYQ